MYKTLLVGGNNDWTGPVRIFTIIENYFCKRHPLIKTEKDPVTFIQEYMMLFLTALFFS